MDATVGPWLGQFWGAQCTNVRFMRQIIVNPPLSKPLFTLNFFSTMHKQEVSVVPGTGLEPLQLMAFREILGNFWDATNSRSPYPIFPLMYHPFGNSEA
jgi:hypothetical protein